MKYFRLNQNEADRELYFANNGLFNFWNQYLILHWNDVHIVVINKPETRFGGRDNKEERPTISELYTALDHVKNDYCGNCNGNICDIANDFGECVLQEVMHGLKLCEKKLWWGHKR